MISIPTTHEAEQKFKKICATNIDLPVKKQVEAFELLTSVEKIMIGAPPFTPKQEDDFRCELSDVIEEGLLPVSTGEKRIALLNKYTVDNDMRLSLDMLISDAIVEEHQVKDLDELKWSK